MALSAEIRCWIGILILLPAPLLSTAYDLELLSGNQYDVIMGSEQTVKIAYNLGQITGDQDFPSIYVQQPNGSIMKNLYDIRETDNLTGTLYLHFLQVQETDLGTYLIYTQPTTKEYDVIVRGISSPVDVYKILAFSLPSAFFVFAVAVTVASVCTLRKRRKKPKKTKNKTKKKKNPYMKRGANISMVQTSPRAENNVPAPSINAITRNIGSHLPPVAQRTLSLRPPIVRDLAALPNVQSHQSANNRQSMNTLESWSDGEDEYENTCEGDTSPIELPRSSQYPYNRSPVHNDPYKGGSRAYPTGKPLSLHNSSSHTQNPAPTNARFPSRGRQMTGSETQTYPTPMVQPQKMNHLSTPIKLAVPKRWDSPRYQNQPQPRLGTEAYEDIDLPN